MTPDVIRDAAMEDVRETGAVAAPSGTGSARAAGTVRPGRFARLFPDAAIRADCRCRIPFGEAGDRAVEVVLDVRGLPPQGQIGATLARMEELPASRRLRHVNSVMPWPLLAMLETRGYRYRVARRGEDDVQLLIWELGGSADLR